MPCRPFAYPPLCEGKWVFWWLVWVMCLCPVVREVGNVWLKALPMKQYSKGKMLDGKKNKRMLELKGWATTSIRCFGLQVTGKFQIKLAACLPICYVMKSGGRVGSSTTWSVMLLSWLRVDFISNHISPIWLPMVIRAPSLFVHSQPLRVRYTSLCQEL